MDEITSQMKLTNQKIRKELFQIYSGELQDDLGKYVEIQLPDAMIGRFSNEIGDRLHRCLFYQLLQLK